MASDQIKMKKYLINASISDMTVQPEYVIQGYLNDDGVRVQLFLTDDANPHEEPTELQVDTAYIGARTDRNALLLGHVQKDTQLPAEIGLSLLRQCGDRVVRRTRFTMDFADHEWKLDFYSGRLWGLKVATLELYENEDMSAIRKPDFIRRDISHDRIYENRHLSRIDSLSDLFTSYSRTSAISRAHFFR